MQPQRQIGTLARWALLWWLLALGVACASPLVQPQHTELVCTEAGHLSLVTLNEDGARPPHPTHSSLDCPVCFAGLLACSTTPWRPQPPSTAASVVPAQRQLAHSTRLAGALPPSRGPPAAH